MDTRVTFNLPFSREEKALTLHETRSNVIAKNIANASTPMYKAKDIDFRAALKDSYNKAPILATSHPNHLRLNSNSHSFEVKERASATPSDTGNTVDSQVERVNFIDNAIRYQASLALMKDKANTILKAIRGD